MLRQTGVTDESAKNGSKIIHLFLQLGTPSDGGKSLVKSLSVSPSKVML